MKRKLGFFAVVVALGIFLSACTEKACPAYQSNNTSDTSQEVG